MLSIMPFDRLGQRDTERPFKAYSRASPPTLTAAPTHSSYPYQSFASSSLIGYSKRGQEGMDLRAPPSGMYDSNHLMDMMSHHHGGGVPTAAPPLAHRGGGMHHSVKADPEGAMQSAYSAHPSAHPMMHGHPDYYSNGGMSHMTSSAHPGSDPHQQQHHHPHHQSALPPGPLAPPRAASSTSPSATVTSSTGGGSLQDQQNGNGNVNFHPSPESSSSSGDAGEPRKLPPKKRALAVPEEHKDGGYWEKRKKNNESAKRSRESRRMKEDQIAMRVVYLEQENLQLRTEVSLLKSEIEKLRCMLYNS